ncbi:unnamed protein product [Cochlearia groenlandica]
MATNTSFLFAIITLLLILNISARRILPSTSDSTDIATRLAEGGLMQCWDALYELKSCTNEIVLFFLNGETKLGLSCCNAVDVITTDCWPAMLTSLGFTPEETNVLRGFCDDQSSSSPAPSPAKV